MNEQQQHQARHQELHKALDELMADFILHTNKLPSRTTVIEFMEWSYQQTISPTEEEGQDEAVLPCYDCELVDGCIVQPFTPECEEARC